VSAQSENCLYNIPTSFLDLVHYVGCGLSRLVWVNVQVASDTSEPASICSHLITILLVEGGVVAS